MNFKEDPKFSVVVPVYDVPADVFKRCLLSIADQDYQNLEVVIVANGGDKAAFDMATEFSKGRENWKVIFTEAKGACNARNVGFEHSTGEIVSFTNSDYILHTGIIRTWVDEMLKHPECGFVYGQYEYRSAQQDVYTSQPFNVFQLQNENYIDCGFPVWAKHVVPWDDNVKSLQDWDFWLTVVEKGVKGHYLGNVISFIAEYPRPKGLSHDSSDNWVERVKFIKKKHGIPINDICVVSVGAPNHGIEIAKQIGADFHAHTLHKPHDHYRALYLIGWYMKPKEDSNSHSRILSRFPRNKCKRIVHFVGADIYWLRMFSVQKIREFAGALQMSVDHILCENEQAQKELAEYDIDAQIVPIAPYTDLTVQPLPEKFTVALYLTDKSDFDKYLQQHTLAIVKAMPDVKFLGYGDANLKDFKAKNFEHRGTLSKDEWTKFVYECSAYLRLVRHDTRPMASDEFIMAGRSVITNIPNDHMDVIDTAGTERFDEWDIFAPGFNPLRWPDTKTQIIQKIREVRRNQAAPASNFWATRDEASFTFKETLDKDTYRETIHRLAERKPEEVFHVA